MSAEPAPIRPSIARLNDDLRELLDLLENPAADGVAIDRLSEQLCRVLDELRGSRLDLSLFDPAERNQLHDALERAMRMNAVARQLVAKRLEVIDAQIGLARIARRALETAADAEDCGDSCDVEG